MREILTQNSVLIAIIIWMLPWKMIALWKAARRDEVWWFIALMLINTLGILEIFYIFVFSKRKTKENSIKKSSESRNEQETIKSGFVPK